MGRLRSTGAVLLAVAAVAGLVAPVAGGTSAGVGDGEPSVSSALATPVSQANNSSVRHVDPDAASAEEDGDALRRWLADRMDKALIDCSQGVQVGDYDACNRTEGQYPEWVSMYAEVSGESGGSGGSGGSGNDTTAQSFENARENQTQLAENVRKFRRTHERYREARENGNTARARELARKLTRLSKPTSDNADALRRTYRQISANSSANFSEAIESVNRIDRNVTRTVSQVRNQSFVATTLIASADSEAASFTDPLAVSGVLSTENGTMLANERVQLVIGNRTVNTTTDEYGGFTVPYRPTWLPLGAREVRVRYVPANTSALLGSSATVPIALEQVRPTVTVTAQPTTVGYNETLTVSGSVSAESVPAPDVPVVVTIDGEPVNATWTGTEMVRTRNNSTVLTGPEGRFTLTTRLPAGVSPGEQRVEVTIPWRNRSLAGTNASAPLAVSRTATELDATGEQTAGREIRVTGQLRARDGTPIRGREVAIRVDGEMLGTATTTENGSFATVLLVPREKLSQGVGRPEALVTVAYDGSGTNLAPSRTTLDVPIRGLSVTDRWTVVLGAVTDALTGLVDDLPRNFGELSAAIATASPAAIVLTSALCVLFVGFLAAGVHWWWTRRSSSDPEESDADGEHDVVRPDEGTGAGTGADGAAEAGPSAGSSFSPADWLFAGRPDEAIQAGYATVRARLGDELGISPSRTHREFYDACREASIDGTRLAALRALVEAYERATFASESLSERVAGEVLDRLSVFSDDDSTDDGDADRNRSGDV